MRHVLVLSLALLFGASLAQADVTSLDGTEFSDTLARTEHLYIAGQPSPEGLRQAKDLGISTIVSLQTAAEIGDFDPKAEAEALGLNYVSIPSGGEDHPFSPAAVERFDAVMASTEEDVLLHCRSGTRATHLYVAWLVTHQGVPLDEAMRRGRQIRFGAIPLEGYLGGRIDYVLKED
ncbi:MAG: sulfur transferase domain-containing protein [Pseudomonadales bacterium]|jgi:uncharacterized protein (TIGR01244 family)|nr:sulfur transferase domain-containing protein [Pseudomonadales bacterium]